MSRPFPLHRNDLTTRMHCPQRTPVIARTNVIAKAAGWLLRFVRRRRQHKSDKKLMTGGKSQLEEGQPLKLLQNGKVTLRVILPDGSLHNVQVYLTVPMMDLLVGICSRFNLNPTYVILNLPTERNPGYLSYKPSSAVSSLQSDLVMVVPKFYVDRPFTGLNLKAINDLQNDDPFVTVDLPQQPSVAYRTKRNCTVATLVEALRAAGRLAANQRPLLFVLNDLSNPLNSCQLLVDLSCKHFVLYPNEKTYQQQAMLNEQERRTPKTVNKMCAGDENTRTNVVKKRLAPGVPATSDDLGTQSSTSIQKRKGKAPPPPLPSVCPLPSENSHLQSVPDDSCHLKPPTHVPVQLPKDLTKDEHLEATSPVVSDTLTDSGINCPDDGWVKIFPPALKFNEEQGDFSSSIVELENTEKPTCFVDSTELAVDSCCQQQDNAIDSISHCDDGTVSSPFLINPALSPFREAVYSCDKQPWFAVTTENFPKRLQTTTTRSALHINTDLINADCIVEQSMPRESKTPSPASSIQINDPRKNEYPRMVVKCFEEEYYAKRNNDDYVNFIRYGYHGDELQRANRRYSVSDEVERNAKPTRSVATVSRISCHPSKVRPGLSNLHSPGAKLEAEFNKMRIMFDNWKVLKNGAHADEEEQKLASMEASILEQQRLVQELCQEVADHCPKPSKPVVNILEHLKSDVNAGGDGHLLKVKMEPGVCGGNNLSKQNSYKTYRDFLLRQSPTDDQPKSPVSVTSVSSVCTNSSVRDTPTSSRISPTDFSPTQDSCLQKALVLEEIKSFRRNRSLKKTTVDDQIAGGFVDVKQSE